MTVANKNIINTYSEMFEGLDPVITLKLIERLSKSLEKEKETIDKKFFEAFGSFPEDKSPEEIIGEIKATRKFKEKDIQL